MHPPTNKRQDIKYTAQPPRIRWGFFHPHYFLVQTLFYLTKVNKQGCNAMNFNFLRLQFINHRLRHFMHYSAKYLTISDRKHPSEAILTYCLIILLTYYNFNPLTYYPFNPLTLSCRPK